MRTPSGSPAVLVVGDTDGGMRLDRFLVTHLSGWSRRRSTAAIAAGRIRVNGTRARSGGALVHPGDVVDADVADYLGELAPQPELSLTILYRDEALIAVDKPAGMPAVAVRPGDRGTVANALLALHPELAHVAGPLEAGLVHRLDNPTSGVLLAARTPADWRRVRTQFRTRRARKLYVAVVAGTLTRSGVISTPLAHRRGDPSRMWVPSSGTGSARARSAITRYRPLRHRPTGTLVAVMIPTGVRHQIRAHLASVGHPVLGDSVYGDPAAGAMQRLMLHAARLTIEHPRTGRPLRLRSPLPAAFL